MNCALPEVNIAGHRDQIAQAGEILVGIVAGHSLAAHHLAGLIRSNQDMVPVILADGAESSATVPGCPRVVVIIDLFALPLPTSEYLDSLSAAIPGCIFLALDQARNKTDVAQFLRAGFAGFVSHDEALHLLGHAIRAVARGDVWTSPEVIRLYMSLTSRRLVTHKAGREMLTWREAQVLELLRRRYTNKEVAALLGISESTVKFHVSNVLMKLNVTNRRDLALDELFQASDPWLLGAPRPARGNASMDVRTGSHGLKRVRA